MDIIRIVGIGLVAMIFAVYLKKQNADYAIYVSILGGVAILGIGFTYLAPVMSVISQYAQKTSITGTQLTAVFKIIGTAYLAQFASDICKDADNSALGAKIETSARFIIAFLSLPIVLTLFEYLASLL